MILFSANVMSGFLLYVWSLIKTCQPIEVTHQFETKLIIDNACVIIATLATFYKYHHWPVRECFEHFVVHLCDFRFKVNPSTHWKAQGYNTEVCSVPSSPLWRPRAPGVFTMDWWRGCIDRRASPQSASACMTPWSNSTPTGRRVGVQMFQTFEQWSIGICQFPLKHKRKYGMLYKSVNRFTRIMKLTFWLNLLNLTFIFSIIGL